MKSFLSSWKYKMKIFKFKYFNYILTIWLYSGEYFKENWKGKINFLIFTYLALKLKYFGISYVHSFSLYYIYKILYKYWNELKKEASCVWVFDNRSNNHKNLIMVLRLHKLTVGLKTQSLAKSATVYFFILFLMKNTNILWFRNRANDLTKQ